MPEHETGDRDSTTGKRHDLHLKKGPGDDLWQTIREVTPTWGHHQDALLSLLLDAAEDAGTPLTEADIIAELRDEPPTVDDRTEPDNWLRRVLAKCGEVARAKVRAGMAPVSDWAARRRAAQQRGGTEVPTGSNDRAVNASGRQSPEAIRRLVMLPVASRRRPTPALACAPGGPGARPLRFCAVSGLRRCWRW